MRLNAEAIRPGSVIEEERGLLWNVLSNDTLERILILEEVGTTGNKTHQSYESGTSFNCVSIPHLRSD